MIGILDMGLFQALSRANLSYESHAKDVLSSLMTKPSTPLIPRWRNIGERGNKTDQQKYTQSPEAGGLH